MDDKKCLQTVRTKVCMELMQLIGRKLAAIVVVDGGDDGGGGWWWWWWW